MARLADAPWAPVAAFTACALIWGSTWLAIKVGYEGIGALTGAALRFGSAALLLALLMVALRAPFPRGRKVWVLAATMAFLLFLLDYGLIYWGEQFVDSGLTAVLFATFPLLTVLVGHAWPGGERLTTRKLAGVLLGLAGLGVVFAESLAFDPARLPAMLAIVGSALAAAISNQYTHRDGAGLHPATYTMPAMGLGALMLLGAGLALGETPALPSSSAAWLSVAYLSAIGSVLAFLAYFWLLGKWGPGKSSMLVLLTPLIALFLGALVLGERPGPSAALGTALVLAGVWVTVRAPKAEPAPPVASPPALDAEPAGK